jgi:hypothetical protein
MNDTISTLIGDVPVSEQLAAALERMAPKDHAHDYATHDEIEELRRKIEALESLVGDTSIADQISIAFKNK